MPKPLARPRVFIAFAIVAALVVIAAVVPAVVVAGILAFIVGYVLGISNGAIGWIALATSIPVSMAAVLWIWPDVAPLALETTPLASGRDSS